MVIEVIELNTTCINSDEPNPIIIRFVHMLDRDNLISAFEHQPRQRKPSTASDDHDHGNDPKARKYERVTIRTDLPPKMKRERGRLASIAFNLRKDNNLSTRIRINATKVFLQTRKHVKSGETPNAWTSWSEKGTPPSPPPSSLPSS